MDVEKEIQNILDRNFERGDNAKAKEELLILLQRELLIAYEIEAAKPYPYDIELIESKVDKYLLSTGK